MPISALTSVGGSSNLRFPEVLWFGLDVRAEIASVYTIQSTSADSRCLSNNTTSHQHEALVVPAAPIEE